MDAGPGNPLMARCHSSRIGLAEWQWITPECSAASRHSLGRGAEPSALASIDLDAATILLSAARPIMTTLMPRWHAPRVSTAQNLNLGLLLSWMSRISIWERPCAVVIAGR